MRCCGNEKPDWPDSSGQVSQIEVEFLNGRSSSGHQMSNQRDDGEYQQQMNQAGSDMESGKAKYPDYKKNYSNQQ